MKPYSMLKALCSSRSDVRKSTPNTCTNITESKTPNLSKRFRKTLSESLNTTNNLDSSTQHTKLSTKRKSTLINIALITGTRAEWGLLYPLAKVLQQDSAYNLQIIATGSHLSQELGNTYQEIEADGFEIAAKIPILQHHNTHLDTAKSLATAIVSFSEYFLHTPPDIAIILGDRYEAFGAAIACGNLNIPIAHICGGDSTQGANDEYMRHCISKISYLHFPSNALSAKRIIQLGESPQRVFNVGSLAVENINNTRLLNRQELSTQLKLNSQCLDRFCLLTFHPTTLESNISSTQEITLILEALLQTPFFILATKANADTGGELINAVLASYATRFPNKIALFANLGRILYLSSLKSAAFMIGNSSSATSEAPIMHTPAINIGTRQKGRLIPESTLSINPNPSDTNGYITSILTAIETVSSDTFRRNSTHPFGNGTSARQIADIIKTELQQGINLKKAFYDVDFGYN